MEPLRTSKNRQQIPIDKTYSVLHKNGPVPFVRNAVKLVAYHNARGTGLLTFTKGLV